jgi:hypothetical protein
VLDAPSITTSANVPAAGQDIDEGKKTAGSLLLANRPLQDVLMRQTHFNGGLGAGETRALVSTQDQAETASTQWCSVFSSGGLCRSPSEVSSRSGAGAVAVLSLSVLAGPG